MNADKNSLDIDRFPKVRVVLLFFIIFFYFVCPFFLVYVFPAILQNFSIDNYFLQFAKNYTVGFLYKNDLLINHVVAVYYIFIYPFVTAFMLFYVLFGAYTFKPYTPSIIIYKNRKDFLYFLGSISICAAAIFLLYFKTPSEPTFWKYQIFFTNRFFFSIFLILLNLGIIIFFISLLICLIDTILSFLKGD